MDASRTADQFFSETARQTARQSASMREALDRYYGELANASRAYFRSWMATQQVGLRAVFDLQDAAIQSTRAMADSAEQVSRALLDQWVQANQEQQVAVLNLLAAGAQLVEAMSPQPDPSSAT